MNGKTHYVVGAAVSGVVTYGLISGHDWLTQHTPGFISPLVSPPATLLGADYVGRAVTSVQNALTVGRADIGNLNIHSPRDLEQLGAGLLALTTGPAATTIITVFLNWLVILAIGMLSALFPDIDHGGSTISQGGKHLGHLIHSRGVWGLFLKLLFWLVNLFTQTLSFLAGFLGGHRGPVHTATAMLVMSVGVGVAANGLWSLPFYGLVFGCGYLSHLVIDSPNPTGIMWLWPVSRKYFHLGLPKALQFHSGSPLANLLIQLGAELIFGLSAYSVVANEFIGVNEAATVIRNITGSLAGSDGGNSNSGLGAVAVTNLTSSTSTIIAMVVILAIVLALVLSSLHSFFQGLKNERWQHVKPQYRGQY